MSLYLRACKQAFFCCILTFPLALSACNDMDRSDIHTLLDVRDMAVSNHDIQLYHSLLMPEYEDMGRSEFEVIRNMNKLFAQFEQTDMQSSDRTIRLLDDHQAECEQSYLLRVKADGKWRQLHQRERIKLTKTDNGWKISGGL